jgi:hypothetical protein
LYQRRRGEDCVAGAALRRSLRLHTCGRGRLARHYSAEQKEMTKRTRCDNKCSLGTHAVGNQPDWAR